MKLKTFLLTFLFTFLSVTALLGSYLHRHPRYVPSVSLVDLEPFLSKETFTASDYALFYEQTGLTAPLIDILHTQPDFADAMKMHQENYLKDVAVTTNFLPPITLEDQLDESQAGFTLGPYDNGYILLTKSTTTANWRHGHAAIIIDALRGVTLEALNPGTSSMEQPLSKWQYYPTVRMYRLKDVPQSTLDAIATYASTQLKGLPYNILADKNQGDVPYETHCALLVWQAFDAFGYDLDATGGLFVSPKNMAMSPLLELLQNYGFHPDEVW